MNEQQLKHIGYRGAFRNILAKGMYSVKQGNWPPTLTPAPDTQATFDEHNARALRYRSSIASAHQVISDLLEILAGYEDGITWTTTCLNCASLMNTNYAQHSEIPQLRDQLTTAGGAAAVTN